LGAQDNYNGAFEDGYIAAFEEMMQIVEDMRKARSVQRSHIAANAHTETLIALRAKIASIKKKERK
jgi:hypothetical protein